MQTRCRCAWPAVAVSVLLLSACVDNPFSAVVVKNTYAAGNEAGTLDFMLVPQTKGLNARSIFNVTGKLTYGNASLPAWGTYEDDTGQVSVSCSSDDVDGHTFRCTVTGSYEEESVESYKGHMGKFVGAIELIIDDGDPVFGAVAGFAHDTQVTRRSQDASTYVGTMGTGQQHFGAGTWTLTRRDDRVIGAYACTTTTPTTFGTFTGSESGDDLTIDKIYDSTGRALTGDARGVEDSYHGTVYGNWTLLTESGEWHAAEE